MVIPLIEEEVEDEEELVDGRKGGQIQLLVMFAGQLDLSKVLKILAFRIWV